MAKVIVKRTLTGASISEAEGLWYDTTRWTGFVDGFGAVERTDGDWPEPGSRVVWDSRPGGRGRVVERTASFQRGQGHVATIEDPELDARQTVSFEAVEDGVDMTVELDYTRKETGPFSNIADMLFVRSAFKSSMRRTLTRFERELTAERELTER